MPKLKIDGVKIGFSGKNNVWNIQGRGYCMITYPKLTKQNIKVLELVGWTEAGEQRPGTRAPDLTPRSVNGTYQVSQAREVAQAPNIIVSNLLFGFILQWFLWGGGDQNKIRLLGIFEEWNKITHIKNKCLA